MFKHVFKLTRDILKIRNVLLLFQVQNYTILECLVSYFCNLNILLLFMFFENSTYTGTKIRFGTKGMKRKKQLIWTAIPKTIAHYNYILVAILVKLNCI